MSREGAGRWRERGRSPLESHTRGSHAPVPGPGCSWSPRGPWTSRGASWDVTRRLRAWTPGGGRLCSLTSRAAGPFAPFTSLVPHARSPALEAHVLLWKVLDRDKPGPSWGLSWVHSAVPARPEPPTPHRPGAEAQRVSACAEPWVRWPRGRSASGASSPHGFPAGGGAWARGPHFGLTFLHPGRRPRGTAGLRGRLERDEQVRAGPQHDLLVHPPGSP